MMKKLSVLLLAMGMLLSGCASDSSEPKDLSEVKIGAIQFAQHPALDKAYEGFKDTLIEAGVNEENIDFQNASGDPSNCQTIAEKFVNDGDDFMLLQLMLYRLRQIKQQIFLLLVQLLLILKQQELSNLMKNQKPM